MSSAMRLSKLSDQNRWGPAKRVAMRMLADGVDPPTATPWTAAALCRRTAYSGCRGRQGSGPLACPVALSGWGAPETQRVWGTDGCGPLLAGWAAARPQPSLRRQYRSSTPCCRASERSATPGQRVRATGSTSSVRSNPGGRSSRRWQVSMFNHSRGVLDLGPAVERGETACDAPHRAGRVGRRTPIPTTAGDQGGRPCR
jgi:hypothetical protein